MNKTKRKIFETSMKLFAEKGYEATSVEDITATVGVAKGTLYYHFSSKEEIFNFLIEEGTKLLLNSVEIKTEKLENYLDKVKAIALIEVKILMKYEDFITILLSQFWGKEEINKTCKKQVFKYISKIEQIVEEGMQKGEIKKGDSKAVAAEIYGLICTGLVYKLRKEEEMTIMEIYKQFENTIIKGLEV